MGCETMRKDEIFEDETETYDALDDLMGSLFDIDDPEEYELARDMFEFSNLERAGD